MWVLRVLSLLAAAAAQQSTIERQAERYALDTVATDARTKPEVDVVKLDCGFRRLALKQAKAIQPFRSAADFTAIFDSLELAQLCGDTPLTSSTMGSPASATVPLSPSTNPGNSVIGTLVDPGAGDDGTGAANDATKPFASVAAALAAVRAIGSTNKTITLTAGVHHLGKTMVLGPADSGTTFVSAAGGMAWLSGGRVLKAADASWQRIPGSKAFKAVLPTATWSDVSEIPGLFTLDPHTRLTRARYPNSNVETTTWGYASPTRVNASINASAVLAWTKPAPGKVPTFETIDLSVANPTGHIKDDSTMGEYNSWTTGFGGICDSVWSPGEPSYWCSNGSAGGWAEVDAACATAGQLQLPVGMAINTSFPGLDRIAKWKNPAGAIVHAWHSQSWATHMFRVAGTGNEIDETGKSATLKFSSGGQQGGRNWCRCDQCGYAGPWCGQHKTPPDNTDTRLISGDWYVEGVAEELDVPGEWHFDTTDRTLMYWPNATTQEDGTLVGDLVIPVLKTLVSIDGGETGMVTDVTFDGVGFRDSAATYMAKEWSAPSGGDWSLYHGGAVTITEAANVTMTGCHFRRLDGNAVYLSGRSRDVVIEKSAFEWLGENAITTKGDSRKWDARDGAQPRGTVVTENIMHDLGLYEKQSSGWGQNKACLATVSKNIMYNLPRAAINFNDALGGGNIIENNLLWNTCRESGDHGAINSWNRQPFLHDLGPGGKPSFTPLPTTIKDNFIFANYGSSQGVDNDDGSSFFDTHDNVFYMADGFKMDYGGHDSSFHDNLVINYPYDGQNCINVGGFKKGHGDQYYNNTCLVGIGGKRKPSGCGDPSCMVAMATGLDVIGGVSQCDPEYVKIGSNHYYSPNGNATLGCGGTQLPIGQVQKEHRIEIGSTTDVLPSDEEIVAWAQKKLGL